MMTLHAVAFGVLCGLAGTMLAHGAIVMLGGLMGMERARRWDAMGRAGLWAWLPHPLRDLGSMRIAGDDALRHGAICGHAAARCGGMGFGIGWWGCGWEGLLCGLLVGILLDPAGHLLGVFMAALTDDDAP